MKEFLISILKKLGVKIKLVHGVDVESYEDGYSATLTLDYYFEFDGHEFHSSVSKEFLEDMDFRTVGESYSSYDSYPTYSWDDYQDDPSIEGFIYTYLTDQACMEVICNLFNPNGRYLSFLNGEDNEEKVINTFNLKLK